MNVLSSELITSRLATRRLGRPALFFPTVGSTNDVAHQQARAGAPDGSLIVADEQTAGRGRLDRVWWAPPGACLLMSLVLRAPLPLRRAGQLTMCLGLGAVEAIEQIAGLRAQLKWPNDLVLEGHKLGGMLTEIRTEGERLSYAVLGLGLNVNVPFDTIPGELAETTTSLLAAGGAVVDRLTLLLTLLERTEVWYDQVLAGDSIREPWMERLDTLGRRVRIKGVHADLEGVAIGTTSEGGLVLRADDGQEHVIWSGDVVSVRPT